MKIALFISGRLTCYEENLLYILTNSIFSKQIDLFVSVNGEKNNYFDLAEKRLNPWLKKIVYENFNVPETFKQNIHPQTLIQIVNKKRVPYTVLSCFYNDKKNMEQIIKYEKENNFEYDVYCKFRADIIFNDLNKFIFLIPSENTIYSCIPPCLIKFNSNKTNYSCISDAFAYGNKKIMQKYTSAYDSILRLNNILNGKYRINYEPSLTEPMFNFLYQDGYEMPDNFYYLHKYKNILNDYTIINNENEYKYFMDNHPIKINYFDCAYDLNNNRRQFDKIKHS